MLVNVRYRLCTSLKGDETITFLLAQWPVGRIDLRQPDHMQCLERGCNHCVVLWAGRLWSLW